MNLSLNLGKFTLQLGTRNSQPAIARGGALSPAQTWLRGEEACASLQLTSPYQQSVWVYTAVSALAQTVSSIPFRISRGERSGENLVTHGPVVDLFNRPHPSMNRFRFWELLVTWYCLRGEAFILALDRADNILPMNRASVASRGISDPALSASPRLRISASAPSSLLVLSPDHFRHLVHEHDLVGWKFTGFPLSSPLPSMDLLPEEVIHDFLPNPHLYWRGMSPLSVALLAAQTDFASAHFMKGLML